jgi:hypothetical protein
MFTQISWGSYITAALVLSACYYLLIGYRYYRNDLLQLISGKKVTANQVMEAFDMNNPLVESFSDAIEAFMNAAGKNELDKNTILKSLPILFKKYPASNDTALRESVQNLIINKCKSYCSIHLSDEELSALWN